MPQKDQRSERIGQTLGDRFRIEAFIGKGAMADVYRALDLTTSAHVALKILRRQLDDASARQRFEREGEVQARLRHRNVAALLDTGVTDLGEPFLVVELLRGKTLRGALKQEGRMPARRALSFTWQALQGLSAVHAAGVLHRDLKPANIMLEPSPGPVERAVLIDFGFASFEGSSKLTQQGTVVGSLTYIAPERLRGEATDPRSDLYAIGVMAFEMLAGRPTFVAADDYDLIDLHLNAPPPSVVALDPTLPVELDDIFVRALAKQQDERYPDAIAMAAAVEAVARKLG
ncbi:MAG: serine/threonine-protein kinase [Proteobacteria bacterium]|nr:serine/threonine-protein kinase [Pseudomonadota bacterium]